MDERETARREAKRLIRFYETWALVGLLHPFSGIFFTRKSTVLEPLEHNSQLLVAIVSDNHLQYRYDRAFRVRNKCLLYGIFAFLALWAGAYFLGHFVGPDGYGTLVGWIPLLTMLLFGAMIDRFFVRWEQRRIAEFL